MVWWVADTRCRRPSVRTAAPVPAVRRAAAAGDDSPSFPSQSVLGRYARVRGTATPQALVEELRRGIEDRRHPWPAFPLAEVIIHGQDIRVALDDERVFPMDRLVVVANLLRLPNYPPVRPQPAKGLRLVATDTDWARGRGPEIRGPLRALVMVMAGRPVDATELSGEGVQVLASQ